MRHAELAVAAGRDDRPGSPDVRLTRHPRSRRTGARPTRRARFVAESDTDRSPRAAWWRIRT